MSSVKGTKNGVNQIFANLQTPLTLAAATGEAVYPSVN